MAAEKVKGKAVVGTATDRLAVVARVGVLVVEATARAATEVAVAAAAVSQQEFPVGTLAGAETVEAVLAKEGVMMVVVQKEHI